MDRTASSGKAKGSVQHLFNASWRSDVAILESHCFPNLEYLTVKCRPYYLPQEFTSAILIAVYIPPHVDVKNALDEIYTTTNTRETKFPEDLFTVASNFNRANLKRVLSNLQAEAEMGGLFTKRSTVLIQGSGRLFPGLLGIIGLDHVQVLSGKPRQKVTGPDRIPIRALGSCEDQLAEVFTNIFKLSLLQAEGPTCFTKTTIIPRLVMVHINSSLPTCFDPLQFSYRCNRSTAESISLALHSSLEHLDNKNTYIRHLLIDYSSTFNTIISSRLISKLCDLDVTVKKAQQRLFFLRLRKCVMSIRSLTNFYRCTIESILSG
eukprot:g32444.t1